MLDWIFHLFRKAERPVAEDDLFSQLSWLGPDENPFGLRVLDCRPFSTTMISTTKDPKIAARFSRLRGSTGEEHRGRSPEEAVVARLDLSYPFYGSFEDTTKVRASGEQ